MSDKATAHPSSSSSSSTLPAAGGEEDVAAKRTQTSIADYYDNNQRKRAKTSHHSSSSSSTGKGADPPPSEENSDNEPLICHPVSNPSNVKWTTRKNTLFLRSIPSDPPRSKVAAFDMDGTLVNWRSSGWPSKLEHYELWSSSIPTKLRTLYDTGKYKLLLISNQGGIRGAFGGKNAQRVQAVMNWIASLIDRPVHAICSTRKDGGYHKGEAGMWTEAEEALNGGMKFDVTESFYVGDSAGGGDEDDAQGGVDKKFAENVGKMRGGTLKFLLPEEYFGESDMDRRKGLAGAEVEPPPETAMTTRASLLGGYFRGPILLVLCGAQGSGKSYFCRSLTSKASNDKESSSSSSAKATKRGQWVHLSQDTINNGKPGKREKVEEAAALALENGQSVVVDRMHLDPDQRSHFVTVANVLAGVPAHALVLNPPLSELKRRVENRTDHPGGVQGERGARMAVGSAGRLVMPTYGEGFDLINCARTTHWVDFWCEKYRGVLPPEGEGASDAGTSLSQSTRGFPLHGSSNDPECVALPPIALGTMAIKKGEAAYVVTAAIRSGIRAIDTAPTYNNEDVVGTGLMNIKKEKTEASHGEGKDPFVIVKVPKRATNPQQVRDEIQKSLQRLQRKTVDLILLHWPCDLIEMGTLRQVWKELEKMKSEGHCQSLGVCNFTSSALASLLSLCSSTGTRPLVNQVERHPFLPQWDLLEYCAQQNIVVQAHTPLGQGRSELLENPTVVKIASDSGLSPGQVLLLWNLQHNVTVVTKCASPKHQRETAALLEDGDAGEKTKRRLTPPQMEALDQLRSSGPAPLRFIAPPFMYRPGAVYSWGDSAPQRRV